MGRPESLRSATGSKNVSWTSQLRKLRQPTENRFAFTRLICRFYRPRTTSYHTLYDMAFNLQLGTAKHDIRQPVSLRKPSTHVDQ